MYDVIIVGAGPAGSTATRILSEEGLNVCQIAKDVGKKVCTGILTPQYTKRYRIDETYIERKLKGIIIENKNHKLKLSFKGDYSIDRKKFDLHLYNQIDPIIQKIEEVRDIKIKKDLVYLKTNKSNYQSRVIITADGTNSLIVKLSGIGYKKTGICAQGVAKNIPDKEESDYFHMYLNYVKNGYGWITPKKDNHLIGIGSATQEINLKEFASSFKIKVSNISYGRIPFYGPIKRTYTDRLLVSGDAAGLVIPFEGGGIYYARRSAELAAETILDCEEDFSRKGLSVYEKKWKSEFGSIFSIFRFLTLFMNSKFFVDLALGISERKSINNFIINRMNKNGDN